jgi:hypothetical protein
MSEQRRVETVEEFKLRIAAIIRAKPEQIPAPDRPRTLKRGQPESKTANYPLVVGNPGRRVERLVREKNPAFFSSLRLPSIYDAKSARPVNEMMLILLI